MGLLSNFFPALLGSYVLYRVYAIGKALRAVKGVPVQFCWLRPLSPYSGAFRSSRWNPSTHYMWNAGRTVYAENDCDALYFVPLVGGTGALYTRSPEAYKQILTDTGKFIKGTDALAFSILGHNLVASEGEMWRKHRKITAPAFNNQTYQDAWEVTTKIYHQMQNSAEWRAGDVLNFPSFNSFTTRVALLVIAATGFNMRLDWDESPTRPDLQLHTPVDEMIVTVSQGVLLKIIFPSWAFKLPNAFLRKIRFAYADLEHYLHSEVAQKRADIAKQKQFGGESEEKNIFARLVQASEAEGKYGLDASELTGNLFIFLFAGHETTAHSLVVTLAYLTGYPDEQEKVYRHIQDIIGDRDPSFQDYNALAPVLYPFYEAVRLYPAAFVQLREPSSDAVLSFVDPDGRAREVVVAKGTELVLDQVNMSRNERLYEDPWTFRPSRWEGTNSEDLLPFSTGPRVCLGKKFALVEAACFLTHLLRDWRVELDLKECRTFDAWQEKFLQPVMGATLKTGDVPLRLVRRSQ